MALGEATGMMRDLQQAAAEAQQREEELQGKVAAALAAQELAEASTSQRQSELHAMALACAAVQEQLQEERKQEAQKMVQEIEEAVASEMPPTKRPKPSLDQHVREAFSATDATLGEGFVSGEPPTKRPWWHRWRCVRCKEVPVWSLGRTRRADRPGHHKSLVSEHPKL